MWWLIWAGFVGLGVGGLWTALIRERRIFLSTVLATTGWAFAAVAGNDLVTYSNGTAQAVGETSVQLVATGMTVVSMLALVLYLIEALPLETRSYETE